MSVPINELPQIQKDILIILRRQTVSTERLVLSLKADGVDCPDPLRTLETLVAFEFVSYDGSAGEGLWSLTNKGKVAAELLWLERRFEDPAKMLGALGGT